MKILYLALIALPLMIGIDAFSISLKKNNETFLCCCYSFKEGKGIREFQINLDSNTVHYFFKEDYPFSGERVNAPKNANILGCLVLVNNDETLIFPFYHWKVNGKNYYSFQSSQPGQAPRFYLVENERAIFFQNLRKSLQKNRE